MSYCKLPTLFANLMLIYLIASVIYLIISFWLGTPFNNALKDYPELVKIKKESAEKRGITFIIGILIAFALVWFFNPFKKCMVAVKKMIKRRRR
jgi:hypothetical protein